MIYLIKPKDYLGVDPDRITKEAEDLLVRYGATKSPPYSEPKNFNGDWGELTNAQKIKIEYYLKFEDGILINEEEYSKVFKEVEVVSVNNDTKNIVKANIDFEDFAKKFKESGIAYNQQLTVHQPDMPLFQYNEFLTVNISTGELQKNFIDKGWRVVSIVPQEKGFPTYIIARYTKKDI